MKADRASNRIFRKVIHIFIIAFFLIYLTVTLIQSYYRSYQSEVVIRYSVPQSISAKGIAVREEEVITSAADGVLHYKVGDGMKMQKGTVVADVFADRQSVRNYQEMHRCISERDALLQAQKQTVSLSLTNNLNTDIFRTVSTLSELLDSGRTAGAELLKAQFADQMNCRQIAVGKEENYEERIALLNSRIDSLSARISEPLDTLTASSPGYFSHKVTGYEGMITPDNMEDLPVSELEALISDESLSDGAPDAVGRVVMSFRWYFAVVLPTDTANSIPKYAKLTITFPFQDVSDITALVIDKKTDSASGKTAVYFSCDNMNSDFIDIGTQAVNIVFKNISGLRVSTRALYFEDGVKGVYVKNGNVLKFVPVTEIYQGEDYILCEAGDLQLYDEIIVRGMNLYDGKVVS